MHARCRSCGAPIVWARTERRGRLMPVDAAISPAGTIALVPLGGGHRLARVVPPGSEPGLRRSHFASCPNADRHRRSRR